MKVPALKVYFSEQDRKEILERIDQCLASGMVAQGRNVEELESAFAAYTGAKHAIAVNSGEVDLLKKLQAASFKPQAGIG